MAITLKKLNNPDETYASLAVPFGDAVLNLTYSRESYTPKLERTIRQLVDANLIGGFLSAMLVEMLRSWDVVQEVPRVDKKSGKPIYGHGDVQVIDQIPVPLTKETFDELLCIEAQAKIVEALRDANRPNLTTSEDTDDTF